MAVQARRVIAVCLGALPCVALHGQQARITESLNEY